MLVYCYQIILHLFKNRIPVQGEGTMDVKVAIVVAIACYLIGSLSFARIVYWLVTRKNLEDFELHDEATGRMFKLDSVSASSVGAALNTRWGMLVSLLDILKAVLPVLGVRLLFPGQLYYLAAAIFVLLGHIFPVYHRFQGSGGYTVMLGSLAVIDWLAAIVLPIAGPLIGMLILRNFVLSLILWVVLLIPWMILRTDDPAFIWYAVAMNVVFIGGMLPQALRILKQRREGQASVGSAWVDSTPMGKSFARMARYLKVKIPS